MSIKISSPIESNAWDLVSTWKKKENKKTSFADESKILYTTLFKEIHIITN